MITGTTLVLLATDAFTKYKSLTGAKLDKDTGLLKVTSAQFAALKTLTFVIGGVCILYRRRQFGSSIYLFYDQTSFGLTPSGQIWPRALNADSGGVAGEIYLIVGDIGNESDSTLSTARLSSSDSTLYSTLPTSVWDWLPHLSPTPPPTEI